ncbi:hypothetical protein AJ80_06474 [Polytolypa hystricis UAMH7299]|uniref:DUF1479 domain protein n=1 Tax=Polytolypa hystricis (strain UAMH7299) TaxID=1447883 RepID=A0A2B7XWV1_POLH7|nr:hypothetical protein AJ80_06474 [Polytolypa hystricis UAMH7299]
MLPLRPRPTLASMHATSRLCLESPLSRRCASTSTSAARKEGDISSVFVSLSSKDEAPPLPERFTDIKRQLIKGREDQIQQGWARLLRKLKYEVQIIEAKGPNIIPSIEFKDIHSPPKSFQDELRKRGVAVIRGVVPSDIARSYKGEIEAYIKANPSTKAFPENDPQVFELYWSKPQISARSHPNVIATQRFLMNFWHTNSNDALISPTHPLTYADRLRIRQPGDAAFALGPHVDGGSVERWEPDGYGLGNIYERIWEGNWEQYDPWEAGCRIPAVSDRYNGAGACSMFRMFQAWLSISHCGPNEGTLLVNPLLSMSTAYMLLRPFFTPRTAPPTANASRVARDTFLEPSNWILEPETTSALQGATPGFSQEFNDALHPHLELEKTMVHIPKIQPGDYVVWHCDSIHSVDKVHRGTGDSSVLYIPACPVTDNNVKYVARQKASFLEGIPPPDFPGGKGESEHIGRATESYLKEVSDEESRRAFGFGKWNTQDAKLKQGEKEVLSKANQILGF